LESKKGKPDEARKYLEEAVKKYALQRGGTEKPRDQYAIRDDAALKPLRDSYLKNRRPPDPRGKEFAQLFFNPVKPYEAIQWPLDLDPRGNAMMMPRDWMWNSSEEPFLFWKTSDKTAYTPSFQEAKDQVEAAWRFAKARKLAREEAERVADDARKADRADAVLQKTSTNSGALFTLDSVSRLRNRPLSRIGVSRQYEAYAVPEDKVEFPKSEFVDQLLSLKQEKGEALVLSDRPEAVFYVAARVNGREPTIEEFYSVYRGAPAGSFQSDPMLSLMEQERRNRYYLACLEQLRTQAKLTITKESRRSADEGGEVPVDE
jgi:hypothetical protein